MNDFETVDRLPSSVDPLIRKQKEDVAKMRASLLACQYDTSNTSVALKNITILRVYHQVSRTIRYIEMMDKIEDKLYQAIDRTLEKLDSDSPVAWMTLLNIQEKMQSNMLNSNKLIQPYLDMLNTASEFTSVVESVEKRSDGILSQQSRDKLRLAAQSVLSELETLDRFEDDESK